MSLEAIFESQRHLNERILPTLYSDIDDPEVRRKWLLDFELAMRQESAELVDSLAWKWWKKGDDNWDNVKIELVDMLHFWVSMCTVVGLTAADVIDLYMKKNALNHHRQSNGYQTGTYEKVKDGIEDNQTHVLNG